MTKFSESIVGKIKCEHIAPVPKWHFLFKGYAFWALFIASMILGSLSFSVVMHIISSGDLDMFKHFQGGFLTSVIMALPYFWIASLGIFAFVAYFNWRCTKQGYRFRRRWIMVGSVGLSIFFGSIFYAFGMGNQIDRVMVKTMPFYDESKHKTRNELWLRPEVGLIMGKITDVDSVNGQMIIQDEQGKIWNIDEKAMTPKKEVKFEEGKIIKVIGKRNGENGFIAKEIRRCGDCRDDEEDDDEDRDDEKDNRKNSEFRDDYDDSDKDENEEGDDNGDDSDDEENESRERERD